MEYAEAKTSRVVTPEMLENLPQPAQRYLRYTGVVGKPWIETARVRYEGQFRLGSDKPWMPMRAEQFYTTNPPGFVWKAKFKIGGLWIMSGQDTYKNSHGHMFGKIAGLFTVFDARGEELDQGTMLRYLNETAWFPIALLNNYITWQAEDDHSVQVTFTDGGRSVSARLLLDDEGRLVNFITQRYRENQGRFTLDTWTTPMSRYGQLAGLNLPVHGQAVWKLAEGDLAYGDLEITEVDYNGPIEAF
jgi:hypothetical protein